MYRTKENIKILEGRLSKLKDLDKGRITARKFDVLYKSLRSIACDMDLMCNITFYSKEIDSLYVSGKKDVHKGRVIKKMENSLESGLLEMLSDENSKDSDSFLESCLVLLWSLMLNKLEFKDDTEKQNYEKSFYKVLSTYMSNNFEPISVFQSDGNTFEQGCYREIISNISQKMSDIYGQGQED